MQHKVAVLADAHFHDTAGDFGLLVDGCPRVMRSWADTRTAARAFNESAGALVAALEKIAAQGVRHVVLAGDYSDDGQSENIRRLVTVLERFQAQHRLRFYAIPGNHDLYATHGKHVTSHYVTAPGETATVTSDADYAAEHGAIHSAAMRCAGQPEALLPMARFGLFRQPDYLHWESPFGLDDQSSSRMYTAHSADGSASQRLMDASYLVEPEPGLWLLMIDANVFEPRNGRSDPSRKKAFIGPSDAGWNALLRVKPFLLHWIADVTDRAHTLGKTLITVSHYPVLDPFQDVAQSELALFGPTSNTRRTPGPQVAQALIAAGLRWHIGGHMHVNATSHTADGKLTDLSMPSLVAFPPAFKILHAKAETVTAQTIPLDDLPPDPAISALYQAEGRSGPPLPFGAFLATQRRANIATRRLPNDWPPQVLAALAGQDARFLVTWLGGTLADFANPQIKQQSLTDCPLHDLIIDAYLIKAAGPLARHWITPQRLAVYRALADRFGDATAQPQQSPQAFFSRFLSVLQTALDRMQADDTQIMPAAASPSPAAPPQYPTAD